MYKYSFKTKLIAYLCICLSLLISSFLYESSIKPIILSMKKENLDKTPVKRIIQSEVMLYEGRDWVTGADSFSINIKDIYEKEIEIGDKKIKVLIDMKDFSGVDIKIKPYKTAKFAIFGDMVEYENGKYGAVNQIIKPIYKENI